MKRLFLLIPVLALSLMAGAKTINITPTYPHSSGNNLLTTLNDASTVDGDVIILADGTYSEYSNYIYFDKSVEVKAAEGAHPVVEVETYIKIGENASGKNITIRGIKFDASKQDATGKQSSTYTHFIRVYSAGTLDFEDCEFYSSTNKIFEVESSKSVANLVVNNCYFRDITHSCIYIENTAASNLTVTNSTFANINATAVSAGIIDTKAASGTAVVDHCTFYDCMAKNTDYGVIGHNGSFTSDFTVSNCIFAWSTTYDKRATYLPSGTAVTNCLTYNTNKDTGTWGHHSGPTFTNCTLQDPLFNNLANNRYTYAGNWVTMNISPARGAATDGSDLGDPRWYSEETLPSIDFATPYQFVGAKAVLSGKIWYDSENSYLYGDGGSNKDYGTATWKFHAEKACVVGVVVNLNSGNTSGHKLRVEVLDADGNSVAEFAEQASTLPGSLTIPAIGDYKIILHDDQTWSSAKIDNITLSYVGGAVQNLPGTTNIADALFSAEGTRADGKIDFPDGSIQDGWVKWNVAFTSSVSCNVTVNIDNANGHNYTVALYRSESDESPITIGEGGEKYSSGTPNAIELGEMSVPAGNYIMKVTNATQYSDAKLISVTFAYAGGAAQNIPCAITLSDAILSSRAYIDGSGYLHFTDGDHLGTISGEWAKWNIHAASEGVYTFTAHCRSTNWSNLTFKVLDTDENELYSYTPEWTYQSDDKTITSPEWILAAGDYVLKLSNPANNSDGYLMSLAAAKSDIIVLDENATSASVIHDNNGVSDKKIALKRSFKADMYNTICLPFSDWNSSLELVFGTGYQLLKLNTATIDGDVLDLEFETVTELGHGRPYLIKPTKDVTNPIFGTGHTIDERTSGYSTTVCDNADFIGNFIKGTIPAGEDNLFLGQNNLLYFSESTTTIKGMRAYFEVKNSSGTPIRHARIVEQSEVVTELELINGEWQEVKSANGTIKTIENGQLILIRDGKRYNAMGIRF